MTLDEFSLLNETDQAGVLIEKGIFIAERHYKNFDIFLYRVDDFYVEIYHNLNFNAMQGMRCFKDSEALEPYLEEIDISCIYEY